MVAVLTFVIFTLLVGWATAEVIWLLCPSLTSFERNVAAVLGFILIGLIVFLLYFGGWLGGLTAGMSVYVSVLLLLLLTWPDAGLLDRSVLPWPHRSLTWFSKALLPATAIAMIFGAIPPTASGLILSVALILLIGYAKFAVARLGATIHELADRYREQHAKYAQAASELGSVRQYNDVQAGRIHELEHGVEALQTQIRTQDHIADVSTKKSQTELAHLQERHIADRLGHLAREKMLEVRAGKAEAEVFPEEVRWYRQLVGARLRYLQQTEGKSRVTLDELGTLVAERTHKPCNMGLLWAVIQRLEDAGQLIIHPTSSDAYWREEVELTPTSARGISRDASEHGPSIIVEGHGHNIQIVDKAMGNVVNQVSNLHHVDTEELAPLLQDLLTAVSERLRTSGADSTLVAAKARLEQDAGNQQGLTESLRNMREVLARLGDQGLAEKAKFVAQVAAGE